MSIQPPHVKSNTDTPKAPPQWEDAQRQVAFNRWLAPLVSPHSLRPETLCLASADASFRRYFRIASGSETCIIMDAPPDKENSQKFVQVANLMAAAGIRVPRILDWDATNGFLLVSDMGPHTLMQTIDPQAPPPLEAYLEAADLLVRWQSASQPGVLPDYDTALLRRELELFPEWYIDKHRQFVMDKAQQGVLSAAFDTIIQENISWPRVFVHRDFMPRNLMPSPQGLGVLDFQDAVYGPITYDIASLMRDAFLTWEEEFCLDVTIRYWQKARKAGLPVGDDFGHFYRGVEWMGLQRHLKILGIFARLTLRDGKPQYLADTPRFIAYVRATCRRYRELGPLARLIETIDGIEVPNAFAFGRV
jgi:aminoglycoside/choline kinase family phosphotransferase